MAGAREYSATIVQSEKQDVFIKYYSDNSKLDLFTNYIRNIKQLSSIQILHNKSTDITAVKLAIKRQIHFFLKLQENVLTQRSYRNITNVFSDIYNNSQEHVKVLDLLNKLPIEERNRIMKDVYEVTRDARRILLKHQRQHKLFEFSPYLNSFTSHLPAQSKLVKTFGKAEAKAELRRAAEANVASDDINKDIFTMDILLQMEDRFYPKEIIQIVNSIRETNPGISAIRKNETLENEEKYILTPFNINDYNEIIFTEYIASIYNNIVEEFVKANNKIIFIQNQSDRTRVAREKLRLENNLTEAKNYLKRMQNSFDHSIPYLIVLQENERITSQKLNKNKYNPFSTYNKQNYNSPINEKFYETPKNNVDNYSYDESEVPTKEYWDNIASKATVNITLFSGGMSSLSGLKEEFEITPKVIGQFINSYNLVFLLSDNFTKNSINILATCDSSESAYYYYKYSIDYYFIGFENLVHTYNNDIMMCYSPKEMKDIKSSKQSKITIGKNTLKNFRSTHFKDEINNKYLQYLRYKELPEDRRTDNNYLMYTPTIQKARVGFFQRENIISYLKKEGRNISPILYRNLYKEELLNGFSCFRCTSDDMIKFLNNINTYCKNSYRNITQDMCTVKFGPTGDCTIQPGSITSKIRVHNKNLKYEKNIHTKYRLTNNNYKTYKKKLLKIDFEIKHNKINTRKIINTKTLRIIDTIEKQIRHLERQTAPGPDDLDTKIAKAKIKLDKAKQEAAKLVEQAGSAINLAENGNELKTNLETMAELRDKALEATELVFIAEKQLQELESTKMFALSELPRLKSILATI